MLIADAEQLPMTDATTPEAEERQTTVKHPRQFRKPRVFKRRSGRKDESFSPGISRGQECRAREKKINDL